MSLLIIHGGPSRTGRTTAVAEAIGAAYGGDVSHIDVPADATIESVAPIVDACEAADAVCFVSPVYRGSYAYPLKVLLDAMPRAAWGETREPLRGKATGIAMVGASHHHFLGVADLRNVLAAFFGAQVLAPGLYFSSAEVGKDGVLVDDAAEATAAYGAALAEFAAFCAGSEAMQRLKPLA